MIGATSIQALPLSFVRPIGAKSWPMSPEEAISLLDGVSSKRTPGRYERQHE